MTKKTKSYKTEILFWAHINPKKKGSFEDYICKLSCACLKSGLKIKFVLGDEISQPMLSLFREFKVDYIKLTRSGINSKWSMFKIVRETRPRILHLTFMDYNYMMNTVCHMMDCRIIITDQISSVSFTHSGFKNALRRLKSIVIASSVNHFIAVSNFVSERIFKYFSVPDKKITTIYNGVDLERFKPPGNKMEKSDLRSRCLQIDNDAFVITYVGQLIEEKGIFPLLDVMQRLVKKHDEIIFVIVGEGILEGHIRRFIKQTNSNKILFLGRRDDVDDIFKASDLAIVPSIWTEAFGFVIAEASACGIPVIGSRIGGIPEVIIDGKTGILVTPGDVNELMVAIKRLLTDRGLYKEFSRAGIMHVRDNFSIHNMVNQTVTIYKRYIN